MKELKKVSHDLFANYYEGENGNLRVTAMSSHSARTSILIWPRVRRPTPLRVRCC